MKAASKLAIATLSSVLLLGSSMNLEVDAASSKSAQKSTAKKAAVQAPTAAEKRWLTQKLRE